jgi:adenine-specific DNA methylase
MIKIRIIPIKYISSFVFTVRFKVTFTPIILNDATSFNYIINMLYLKGKIPKQIEKTATNQTIQVSLNCF